MAITKETKIIKTEIVGDYKAIQIAEDIIYKEDGVETNRVRHRRVLHPGYINGSSYVATDISGESSEIQGICNTAWTDSVKTAWETKCKAEAGL